VIVSHRYRFIFLRTEKTGGTSLTRALWPHLGEEDLRLSPTRPAWARYSPIHHGALQRYVPDLFGLHAHATARQMRRVLGREVFDGYLKFAVERNPWDRQVSPYHHRCWKTGRTPDFDRDMASPIYRNTEYCRLDNWSIYAIGGEIVADRVLRYERLAEDVEALRRELGIPEPLEMPRARAYAPDRPHYATYYGARTRDLVARWYAREIAAFGYAFEAAPGAAARAA
jgi:hypothetical protein